MTGFVLAGGKSSRLGRDKVLLPWGHGTLLTHTIHRLEQVCGTVCICSDRGDLQEHLTRPADSGATSARVPDAAVQAGPLAGIVAALESTRTAWNFFLAVDLPLVPVAFLRELAAHIPDVRAPNLRAPGMQAPTQSHSAGRMLCLLPRVGGRPQPLCGIYHRALVPGLRCALEQGRYKIMLALAEAAAEMDGHSAIPFARAVDGSEQPPALGTPASRVKFVEVEEEDAPAARMVAGDTGSRPSDWFLNINTPGDLRRARDLAARP